jgi:hypothetical protein
MHEPVFRLVFVIPRARRRLRLTRIVAHRFEARAGGLAIGSRSPPRSPRQGVVDMQVQQGGDQPDDDCCSRLRKRTIPASIYWGRGHAREAILTATRGTCPGRQIHPAATMTPVSPGSAIQCESLPTVVSDLGSGHSSPYQHVDYVRRLDGPSFPGELDCTIGPQGMDDEQHKTNVHHRRCRVFPTRRDGCDFCGQIEKHPLHREPPLFMLTFDLGFCPQTIQ